MTASRPLVEAPLVEAVEAPLVEAVAAPLVEARGLSRSFGEGAAARRAVDGVDLAVRPEEVVLIFGPSGCGKSTLLGLLGGLDRNYRGELRLFDRDVAHLRDAELSRLRGEKIGFVFQAFHLLGHLSVLDNVLCPSLFSRSTGLSRPIGADGELSDRGLEVLERVGLRDRARARPAELSGGQRQRVAIARALLNRPALLLCDEPTGNLDRTTGEQIIDLFAELHAELRTTFVIVTHEDRLMRLASRTLSMLDGRLEQAAEATSAAETAP